MKNPKASSKYINNISEAVENTFTLDDLAEIQKKQMAINRKIKSRNDKIDIISLGGTVKDAVNKVINQKIASQKIKVHSERKKIIKQYKKMYKKSVILGVQECTKATSSEKS